MADTELIVKDIKPESSVNPEVSQQVIVEQAKTLSQGNEPKAELEPSTSVREADEKELKSSELAALDQKADIQGDSTTVKTVDQKAPEPAAPTMADNKIESALAVPESLPKSSSPSPQTELRPPSVISDTVKDLGSKSEEPQHIEEPSSRESGRHPLAERSLEEEELLSTIENVKDWAEESPSEEEEEEAEEEEEEGEEEDEAVDDDRDKRNPQYIPRNGPYYLHDDRQATSEEESANEEEEESEATKKPVKKSKRPEVKTPQKSVAKPAAKEVKKTTPAKVDAKKTEAPELKEAENTQDSRDEPESSSSGRWQHDLYTENQQISRTDSVGSQRGKRNRRYNRYPDPRGTPRGRRGSGGPPRRGGFRTRGGRGGYPPEGQRVPQNPAQEPEVNEKENLVVRQVNQRGDEAPQKPKETKQREQPPTPAAKTPQRRGGAAERPAGRVPDAREIINARRSEQNTTPRYQNVEDWDYDEEFPDRLPVTPRQRGSAPRERGMHHARGSAPSSRPPVARSYSQQSDQKFPPRRYNRSYEAEEFEEDEYEDYEPYDQGYGNAYQSRVFFGRGRGHQRMDYSNQRGSRRPVMDSRRPVQSGPPHRPPPPQDYPRRIPVSNSGAMGGNQSFSNQGFSNRAPPQLPSIPPENYSGNTSQQSKRYSSRQKPAAVGSKESDDVRNTGVPQSNPRQYYNHRGGGYPHMAYHGGGDYVPNPYQQYAGQQHGYQEHFGGPGGYYSSQQQGALYYDQNW